MPPGQPSTSEGWEIADKYLSFPIAHWDNFEVSSTCSHKGPQQDGTLAAHSSNTLMNTLSPLCISWDHVPK